MPARVPWWRHQVRFDVEHLALSPEPIESSRVAGGLALREHVRQFAKAIAGRGQLPLSNLRGLELSEGESQIGPKRAGRRRRPGWTWLPHSPMPPASAGPAGP